MERILVNITSDFSKEKNLEAVMPKEIETTEGWKKQGILEHLFIKTDEQGAALVFKNKSREEVETLVNTLPLANCFVKVEYVRLNKSY